VADGVMAGGRRRRLRVLLELQLRLQWRSARGRGAAEALGASVMLVVVGLLGVGAGFAGYLLTEAFAQDPAGPAPALWIGGAGLLALLLYAGLFGGGAGSGFDVSRLFHMPVAAGEMVLADAAARFLGPWSLPPAAFFGGSALACAWEGHPAFAALLPAALVLWLLQAHLVLAAGDLLLFNLRRSRRLMEAVGLLGTGLFVALLFFQNYLATRLVHGLAFGGAMRWLTHAWGALGPFLLLLPGLSAVSWVGAGRWAPLRLAAALAEAAGLLALGRLLLVRLMERGSAEGRRRTREGRREAERTSARPLERLAIWPFCVKDFRYLTRDPYLKTALMGILLYPFLWVLIATGPGFDARGALLHVGLPLVLLLSFANLSTNHLAVEREGLLLLIGSPAPRWRLLAGKNLLLMGLYLAVTAAVEGYFVWRGVKPGSAAADLVMAFSMGLIYFGLGNLLSLLMPMPVAPRGRRLVPQVSGAKMFLVIFAQFAMLGAVMAVDLPVILGRVAMLHVGSPLLAALALPAMLLYGALIYAVLLAAASRLMASREPAIYEALVRGSS